MGGNNICVICGKDVSEEMNCLCEECEAEMINRNEMDNAVLEKDERL